MSLRRQYRIDMAVSRQADQGKRTPETGPRARMKKVMLDTAMELMERGVIPSVSEVAEAAGVSRATAYRYFPSQAAMIQAAVGEALGPILDWHSDSIDAEDRITRLIAFAYPRMETYETTLRAALQLAIAQWARHQAGALGEEQPIVRGHRKALLSEALRPLERQLPRLGPRLELGDELLLGVGGIPDRNNGVQSVIGAPQKEEQQLPDPAIRTRPPDAALGQGPLHHQGNIRQRGEGGPQPQGRRVGKKGTSGENIHGNSAGDGRLTAPGIVGWSATGRPTRARADRIRCFPG